MEDELTLKQSIGYFLMQVPEPVRNFVLNELSSEVQKLMDTYSLHIDQGGTLQAELLLMLLGQSQPTQFMSALQEAGIAPTSIQGIMKDVNENIFKRLREEEKRPPAAPIQESLRTAPPAPTPAYTPPAPTPTPQPTPEPIVPELQKVRTMNSDMELLKSGGFQTAPPPPSAWAPTPPPPAATLVTQPAPVQPPAPQQQTPVTEKPIVKEYTSDPYREPIQ